MKRGVILIIIFLLSISLVQAAVRIDPFFPSASQNLRCTVTNELEPFQFKWYINDRLARAVEQFEPTSIVFPAQIFYTNEDIVKCEVYINTGQVPRPWELTGQSEVTIGAFACNDGFDNDRDGTVDFNDPGCSAEFDDSEVGNVLVCDDGIDNDRDGTVDFNDPGCYRNPRETDEGKDNYFTNNCLVHQSDLFCLGLGFSDLKLLCDNDPQDSKCTSLVAQEAFRQCARNQNDSFCSGIDNVVDYCVEDYRNNLCRFILLQKNICNDRDRSGCFFLSKQDERILCSVDNSYDFCAADVVIRAGTLGNICIEGDTCLEGECINNTCQLVGDINLPCRPNNLCDQGLTCQNNVCLSPPRGGQNQACRPQTPLCNLGLECVENRCILIMRGGVNLPCRNQTPLCNQGLTCQNNVCLSPQRGGINQECLPNNICNAGLVCQNNVCQQPRGNFNEPCLSGNVCFNGLVCISNRCQVPVGPQEGDEGGICRQNNMCNNNLVCIGGRCGMPQGPQPGEEGGICVEGNLCLSGLICNNNRCQVPQGPLPGTEGGECLANGLCNAGLRCKNNSCEKIPGWEPEPTRKRPTPQQPIVIIQPPKLPETKHPIIEPVPQPFSNSICGDNWCDFTEDAVSCPNDCVLEVKQQNDDYFKLKLLVASLILVFFFFTIVAYKEAFAVFARALKKQ